MNVYRILMSFVKKKKSGVEPANFYLLRFPILIFMVFMTVTWGKVDNSLDKKDNINKLTHKPFRITLDEAREILERGSLMYRRCKRCHIKNEVFLHKMSTANMIRYFNTGQDSLHNIHTNITLNRWAEKLLDPDNPNPYIGAYLTNFSGNSNIDIFGTGEGTDMENSQITLDLVDIYKNKIDKEIRLREERKEKRKRDKKIHKSVTHEDVIKNDFLKSSISYIIRKNKVVLSVSVKNIYANAKGGVSISFPQFSNADKISYQSGKKFNTFKSYASGSKLWSGKVKKTIRSNYLLIEGWSESWKKYASKDVFIEINTKDIKTLVINIRALLLKNKNEVLLPTYGKNDQQGYAVKQLVINLQDDTKGITPENNDKKVAKKIKARHILVHTKQEARMLIDMMEDASNVKKDFIKLAKKYSSDPSGKKGGDLGWFKKGKMIPEFDRKVFSTDKKGLLKTPLKTEDGWHVIYIEEISYKINDNDPLSRCKRMYTYGFYV